MATVTAEIKKILKQKDQGILSGTESMRGILKNLHKQITSELGQAALGSWDTYHLRQVLGSVEDQMIVFEGLAKKELSGLLDKSWEQGKLLIDAPLAQTGIYTGFHLSTSVLESLKGYSNDYLENLFGNAWYKVKGEINLGVLGAKTPQQVTEAIGRTVDSGKFKDLSLRAERITQTEMGRVFSEAGQKRMEQAAENVPSLKKEWQHVGHPRMPRPTHLLAHGQRVPVDEPFNVGGVMMMFPRDPAAPLDEVINCGCDHVPWHEKWA